MRTLGRFWRANVIRAENYIFDNQPYMFLKTSEFVAEVRILRTFFNDEIPAERLKGNMGRKAQEKYTSNG